MVSVDHCSVASQPTSPNSSVPLSPRGRDPVGHLLPEVHDTGCGAWHPGDQFAVRHRRRVAVGDHRPVPLHGQRHRHRRMPLADPPGHRQVDALLLQGADQEVAVEVVTERGGQRGAQAQPAGRDRQVGDPAGAGSHPLGRDLGAGRRQRGQPGQHDVQKDRALHDDIELAAAAGVRPGPRRPARRAGPRSAASAGGSVMRVFMPATNLPIRRRPRVAGMALAWRLCGWRSWAAAGSGCR